MHYTILNNPSPFIDPAWKSQDWDIDPISGNDNAKGDVGHGIKTWTELRRRMKLAGGHISAVTNINVLSDLPDTDLMVIDWGTFSAYNQINVNAPNPTITRTGTFTSAPTARNAATNQPNVVTDTGVADWTSDIGWTSGSQLKPTAGPASGYAAWVVKNLGSNQARTSPFFNANTFAETNPASGNTYKIEKKTFVRNWFFQPLNGVWYINGFDLGDASSSTTGFASIGYAVSLIFVDCAILGAVPTHNIAIFYNCCFKAPLTVFGSQVQIYAGACGALFANKFGEFEDGSDVIIDGGFITQGVRHAVVNYGYARLINTSAFDSPDYGWGANSGSKLRMQILYGSGNTLYGLLVGKSGKAFHNPLSSCTITGATADISFAGTSKSWADVLSASGYLKDTLSEACISPL